MSHGNVTVITGTCPVCRRNNHELCRYTAADGSSRFHCTDEFACADAHSRLPKRRH